MATSGVCKLCGHTRGLVESHILPNSFYKPALASGSYPLLMRARDSCTHTRVTGRTTFEHARVRRLDFRRP
jgi:hypothetical protein